MNHNERRKREERRLIDLGPPAGMEERRLNPERRKPEIKEQILSDEEWARYFSHDSPDSGAKRLLSASESEIQPAVSLINNTVSPENATD